MDLDGGMSKYPANKAGAKYGTGYCDSQCPRDLKFIDGQANVVGWQPSSTDQNAGVGPNGSCCSELDIWEANSISAAFTPHPCTTIGQYTCSGDACGGTYSSNRYAGECDPDGCDFNPYRQGVTDFYGPGMTVDTKSKFTVVTQFFESGGELSEIKRFYVQNGKVIPNSQSQIAGVTGNSITQDWCKAQKAAFNDTQDSFDAKGGLAQMGKAMAGNMVLVLSIWDDHAVNMLWLDSTYPTTGGQPGDDRGTCATTSGVPSDIETSQASNKVTYSNIKFGPINSTFASGS
jgi:cellulose 1,4-beta-cellobiosidase